MITLTVSTNGMGRRPTFKADGPNDVVPDCHEVSDIEYVRYCGDFKTDRNLAVLRLTRAQAIELMDDIRSQIDYAEVQ